MLRTRVLRSPERDVIVMSAGGQQYQASANGGGSYSLNGLTDGAYTVYVVAAGYDPNQGTLTVHGGTGSASDLR